MDNSFIEASYPIDFRFEDAKRLGEMLRHGHSVDIVGMKKVGISNFLRFFLYNKDIVHTYINGNGEKHIFIPIDLNELIEREINPFWILTFKRIIDATESLDIDPAKKRVISRLFLDSIQSGDMFLTYDNIRTTLMEIVRAGILPTIFFIRFDRLKDAVTPEFFNNLLGLREATAHKLSYVFTSFRTLNELAPDVFKKEAISVFSQSMYVKPAEYKDIVTIFNTFKNRYQLSVKDEIRDKILGLSGGHVQYLQLSLIILKELIQESKDIKEDIENKILSDERINLQSEELWESLNETEREILLTVLKKQEVNENEKLQGKYLWESGFILQDKTKGVVFSPIFENFLQSKAKILKDTNNHDFTKKENSLFNFLKDNLDNLCDREKIIETVWPEYEELGVSDWAVDRLVARVRTKLKNTQSPYEIVTVKTRGYKLVSK